MRLYFIIFTIIGLCVSAAGGRVLAQAAHAGNLHGTTFFYTLNDVPVMPGLRELGAEALHFDKPEGRIVAATAVSETVSPAAVQAFYARVLPELGWQPAGAGVFLRGSERLRLNIQAAEGVSIVRLQVAPR